MGPHPAVAQARSAVRRCLADLPPGTLVLAACSGGADSLCLAAALAQAAPRLGLRAGAVTVDHGLQPGSADLARQVTGTLTSLGLSPVEQVTAVVPAAAGHGGPEAAARSARYAAFDEAAARTGAAAVLLAHTRDDQAETVLLGLARGAGSRSLAGMPERRGRYRRPLLGTSRATVRAACAALGLQPWDDPQNADPAFARARVRHQALPALEAALGPGVAAALARTAALLRADAEVLEELARAEAGRLREPGGWPARQIAALPAAIRSRVLRAAAIEAGCPPGRLSAGHVGALDELVAGWLGQRWADLPGGVRASRRYDKLLFTGAGARAAATPAGQDAALPGAGLQEAGLHGAGLHDAGLHDPEGASGRE